MPRPVPADTGRRVTSPCVVAIYFVEDGGKRYAEAMGVAGGTLRYRKRIGEVKFPSDAWDRRHFAITDSLLGQVVCFDRATGAELWRRPRGPEQMWLSLAAGRVIVNTDGKDAVVLNAASGRPIRELGGGSWRFDSTAQFLCGDREGEVVVLDAATFSELWRIRTELKTYSQFLGADLFVRDRPDRIRCLNPRTGAERFSVSVPAKDHDWWWVDRMAGGFVLSTSESVIALSAGGAEKWSIAMEDGYVQSVREDLLVVRSWRNNEMRVVDGATGREVWKETYKAFEWMIPTGDNSSSGSWIWGTATDRTLWLADAGQNELELRDLRSGASVGTVRDAGGLLALGRDRERVYVLTRSSLRCCDSGTGRALSTIALPSTAIGGYLITSTDE